MVSGYRRLFNLRPDHYPSSAKLSDAGIENAALNVEPAPGEEFNALAFPVTDEELASLDIRERYYERKPVRIRNFDTGEELGVAYTYVGAPDSKWIERDVAALMPLWRDVVWARTGAFTIGDEFGAAFDRTTYLADGETRVIDVYRDALQDVSDVEWPS